MLLEGRLAAPIQGERQAVDIEPDTLGYPLDGEVPTRGHVAHQGYLVAALTGEQPMPGVLGQQARCHPEPPGPCLQLPEQGRCQRLAADFGSVLGQVWLERHPEQAGEIVGLGQQLGAPLPVGGSGGRFAGDMATEGEPGGIRCHFWYLTLHQRLVVSMQGAQQHGAAPAIEHGVVGAQDHLVVIGGQFKAGDAQQRRLVQCNGMGQILLAIGGDTGVRPRHAG
ncbi:hypothetical protein D3C79_653100 [compost metagenome]